MMTSPVIILSNENRRIAYPAWNIQLINFASTQANEVLGPQGLNTWLVTQTTAAVQDAPGILDWDQQALPVGNHPSTTVEIISAAANVGQRDASKQLNAMKAIVAAALTSFKTFLLSSLDSDIQHEFSDPALGTSILTNQAIVDHMQQTSGKLKANDITSLNNKLKLIHDFRASWANIFATWQQIHATLSLAGYAVSEHDKLAHLTTAVAKHPAIKEALWQYQLQTSEITEQTFTLFKEFALTREHVFTDRHAASASAIVETPAASAAIVKNASSDDRDAEIAKLKQRLQKYERKKKNPAAQAKWLIDMAHCAANGNLCTQCYQKDSKTTKEWAKCKDHNKNA